MFFHVVVSFIIFFALSADYVFANTITVFKYLSQDYPLLPNDEVTFFIYPNPFAHQFNASQIDPKIFGTSLIITDNALLDSDPMIGVIELSKVNSGVYGIVEINSPKGTNPINEMISTVEFPADYPRTHVTNQLTVDIAELLLPQIPQVAQITKPTEDSTNRLQESRQYDPKAEYEKEKSNLSKKGGSSGKIGVDVGHYSGANKNSFSKSTIQVPMTQPAKELETHTNPKSEPEEPACGAGTEMIDGVCKAIAQEPEPEEPTCGAGTELVNGICQIIKSEPEEPTCGAGTELIDGFCQVIAAPEPDGGCLIATAAYGTELAPQVQLLREVRDNTVMSTSSGMAFMTGFNQLYYSFSPTIADWQRENPMFQEAVRAFITPMVSTLSIMTLADGGSETKVLGLGMSVIALNLGMYVAAPTIVAWQIKKRI